MRPTAPWFRSEALPVCIAIAVGVLISATPHFVNWSSLGGPFWFADYDEVGLYLPLASKAYFNHPLRLSDPVVATMVPSSFPWVQLVPAISMASVLGLPPLWIGFLWRLIAGAAMSIACYFTFRAHMPRGGGRWACLAMTLIFLTDTGLMSGHLFFKQYQSFFSLISSGTERGFLEGPHFMPQWRIITPGLSLHFLLLYVFLLRRSLTLQTRQAIALSGVGLGILFYAYFYYWTAALLGLVIAALLDRKLFKVYFQTAILGVLMGAPGLISDFLMKAGYTNDWLLRADKFVSIPHFSELIHPRLAWVLLAGALYWVLKQKRELRYLWALAFSGLLLLNHQIFTGLQIENFHWTYVWAPITSMIMIVFLHEQLTKVGPRIKQGLGYFVAAVVVGHLLISAYLRYQDSVGFRTSTMHAENYRNYRDSRLQGGVVHLKPNVVMAGEAAYVDHAVISENLRPLNSYAVVLSPVVDRRQWHERVALNAYLRGLDEAQFRKEQKDLIDGSVWGPWARSQGLKDEFLEVRMSVFHEVEADHGAMIGKYDVKYVALAAQSQHEPAYLKTGSWKLLQASPLWRLWERQ